MHVELVTIGDELLLGFTIDTNAAHIARALAGIGVVVSRRTTVGDDEAAIASAVADALGRADGVITTGGIGPTADDRTKQSIAGLFGKRMVFHKPTLDALEARWRRRGLGALPATAREQAMVPEDAELLDNRHGSAPGIWLNAGEGKWVVMIPGVPREMRDLLDDEIVPRLRERAGGTAGIVASRTLRTTGMPESNVADLVAELTLPEGVSLAYLPSWAGVDLRVTTRGVPRDVAGVRLEDALAQLRPPLRAVAYGEDDSDLAVSAIAALQRRGWSIATGESCTGGLVMERLTAVPGASVVVRGGIVAYDNDVKAALLGVATSTLAACGAVSEETAREMAAGVRRTVRADVGVGITGVAGPGGGTLEKPVGMVCFAVEWPGGSDVRTVHLPGDRAEVRLRASQAVLAVVARAAGGETGTTG